MMTSTEELYKLIRKANEEQTKTLAEVNERQTKLLKEEIKNTLKEVQEKLDNTTKELNSLKEKHTWVERRTRRNNIIIFGFEATKDHLLQDTLSKLNNFFDIEIVEQDINHIYQIGKKTNSPIVVEFLSFLKKQTIFNQVGKLKGSGITITNDLCQEDREERKILRYHQKKALSQNLDAKIRGSRLIIGKNSYSIEELKETNVDEIQESDLEGSDTEESAEEKITRRIERPEKTANKKIIKKNKDEVSNTTTTTGGSVTRGQKKK